jgi:glycosyltransferase involved in cell wall biosynthesis
VIIEMLMFGIPLIVADTTGATESIVNNRTGFVLPVLMKGNMLSIDINLLEEKIVFCLTNHLNKCARSNYLEKYNEQLFVKKMLYCYNK